MITILTNQDIAQLLCVEAKTLDKYKARALVRGAALIGAHPVECHTLGTAPDIRGVGPGIKRRVEGWLQAWSVSMAPTKPESFEADAPISKDELITIAKMVIEARDKMGPVLAARASRTIVQGIEYYYSTPWVIPGVVYEASEIAAVEAYRPMNPA